MPYEPTSYTVTPETWHTAVNGYAAYQSLAFSLRSMIERDVDRLPPCVLRDLQQSLALAEAAAAGPGETLSPAA